MIGIYQIKNLVSKKIYVGSSTDIDNRWSVHRKTLRNGSHHNRYLQRAWNKYGEDSFVFGVIEETTGENLLDREQYWLDTTMCTDRKTGYNLNEFANGSKGLIQSEDVKETLRQINRGKTHTIESRNKISTGYVTPSDPEKKRLKLIEQNLGDNNPMFGKMWINDGTSSTRINKTDPIPHGYKKGRLPKMSS